MRCAGLVFVALSTLPCLFGSSIGTYTFTGTASGTIGGTAFSDATLTVTATGDISSVDFTSPTYFLYLPGGSSTFTISGIGSGTFTDETDVFDNTTGLAGFGDQGATMCCDIIQMYDGLIGSTDFTSYNLQSSIGPLGPEASDPSTGDWVGLNTSLGSFTVSSYDGVVFQATVTPVPEPNAFPLLGVGLFGTMIFMARRKRLLSRR
jgi:PEP-CTERM motif